MRIILDNKKARENSGFFEYLIVLCGVDILLFALRLAFPKRVQNIFFQSH